MTQTSKRKPLRGPGGLTGAWFRLFAPDESSIPWRLLMFHARRNGINDILLVPIGLLFISSLSCLLSIQQLWLLKEGGIFRANFFLFSLVLFFVHSIGEFPSSVSPFKSLSIYKEVFETPISSKEWSHAHARFFIALASLVTFGHLFGDLFALALFHPWNSASLLFSWLFFLIHLAFNWMLFCVLLTRSKKIAWLVVAFVLSFAASLSLGRLVFDIKGLEASMGPMVNLAFVLVITFLLVGMRFFHHSQKHYADIVRTRLFSC